MSEADFRARARRLQGRLRRRLRRHLRGSGRLLRRQVVPVHRRRPLGGGRGAAPGHLPPAGNSPSPPAPAFAGANARACTATTSPTPKSTGPWTWAWAGSWWTACDELDRVGRIAAGRGEHGQGHAAADPRRARPHPRVHRHRARGPEVRPLHGRRTPPTQAGLSARRGGRGRGRRATTASTCWACTATSARRSSSRRLRAGRREAAGLPRRHAGEVLHRRCRNWTWAAATASPTPPADTPRPAAEIAQAMAAVVRSTCAAAGHHGPADLDRAGPRDRGQHHVHPVRGRHPEDRAGGRAGTAGTAAETLRTRAAMCRWTAA